MACCQPNAVDDSQLLRAAAQLVSRGELNLAKLFLILIGRRERTERTLAELARQALKMSRVPIGVRR